MKLTRILDSFYLSIAEGENVEKIHAEGERAAICGYNSQYRISASLILRRLQERNLEWIRIADPKGGRLDDFQIGNNYRVDAYQIKWSEYPDNFTFNDLIVGQKGKPSLILQLVEEWKELSKSILVLVS